MSALVLFASIAVVGGWGIDGFRAGDEADEAGAQIIFEGGAPLRDAGQGQVNDDGPAAFAEDDYVVGTYGDPVNELYASDDNGGWGDSFREPSSQRTPSITRGALAD
ncbi:hypothetical protein [Aurantiacibacter odishensis]|uniref:hypothetical protein n=1 Tax=Aurantiacibacter odishensis TaxID=1155476 RepID=UPI0013C3E8F0|nr:hypothetical protein [Aurantiacibacter odishensis]